MDEVEQQLRELEAAHTQAIFARDETALNTIWSPGMIVNAPNNTVGDAAGTIAAMRAGFVHYHAYEQSIEAVKVFGDTAVVLGQERIEPILGPDAGKTVHRRFLNVWQRSGDRWVQIARQATVISVS